MYIKQQISPASTGKQKCKIQNPNHKKQEDSFINFTVVFTFAILKIRKKNLWLTAPKRVKPVN